MQGCRPAAHPPVAVGSGDFVATTAVVSDRSVGSTELALAVWDLVAAAVVVWGGSVGFTDSGSPQVAAKTAKARIAAYKNPNRLR